MWRQNTVQEEERLNAKALRGGQLGIMQGPIQGQYCWGIVGKEFKQDDLGEAGWDQHKGPLQTKARIWDCF